MESDRRMGVLRSVLGVQAALYFGTGLWALVSPGSFQKVTGPKTDVWLLKTVGVLVMAIGMAQASAAGRAKVHGDAVLLGAASAVGLTGIDVVYVATRRISAVYLLDAAAELALAGLLTKTWWGAPRR